MMDSALTDDMTSSSTAAPEQAALDLYFQTETGDTFKSTVLHSPYFYVIPTLPSCDYAPFFENLISTLLRLYETHGLTQVQVEYMVDLDQVNHLSPKNRKGRPMLKLLFHNVQQLMDVRKRIQQIVTKNQARQAETAGRMELEESQHDNEDVMSTLVDMREYDVPYLVRVCTDLDIRAGAWYTVTPNPPTWV